MNKKLLTAAIGAALAAGPMLAQADVKLYGKVHMSVDYIDGKGGGDAGGATTAGSAATSRRQTNVSSNASRWGIDVSEKLGGGLTALAKLEQQINADGDGNSQDTRNRYVGLQGKFGKILAGTMDTPFKDISRNVELFPEMIGDNRNIVSLTQGSTPSSSNATLGWDLRPANALKYSSPNMNGFTVSYLYSADTTAVVGTEDNRRRADSIGVQYAKGPLYVDFAYETHRFNNITDGGNPVEKGQRLGASYNFGAFKLVGMYQNLKDLGGTNVITGATSSSVNTKAWVLGGAYTAGNNVFKLQYAKAKALSNYSTGASADGTGAKLWALGWDHLFSKTTKMYVAYAKTDNESAASYTVNGPSGGARTDSFNPGLGGDPSAWSVGMIVDF